MVHKTNQEKGFAIPTKSNGKTTGIHHSGSWLDEMNRDMKRKEQELRDYEKEIETLEAERQARWDELTKKDEMETERNEEQIEKEKQEDIQDEYARRQLERLGKCEDETCPPCPTSTPSQEPLIPKVKESAGKIKEGVAKTVDVGRKVSEKIFPVPSKKLYKELGVDYIETNVGEKNEEK